jgi:protocatechuate 3,4-dioxygenase beta subunit
LHRRELLATLGAGLGAALTACASSSPTSPGDTTITTGTSGTGCAITPGETEGPYPDKTGMLNNAAFFRRDVREDRSGLPLTLTLTIVNVSSSCSPVSNASVEIWQCDASGNYSEYAQPGYDGTGKTFLRGLQSTDANGQVTFTTIYPGWYAGRATHIHVEVFRGNSMVKTTQIAFPENVTQAVYATGVYAAKGQSSTTNSGDMVFSDGTQYEMATLTGNTSSGYTATLTIGISI